MNTSPTETVDRIVIVGAGLAGVHAAEELRASGYDRDLTLISAEAHTPYDRPPLSKDLLLGTATTESIQLHPDQWYADQDIQLLTSHNVASLHIADRRIRTGAFTIGYDRLLLATGASARRLALADASGADVRYLRTQDDAIALKERLTTRLLIVGGGWIGLEIAAAARAAGGSVVLAEDAPLPLAGVLGAEIASVFADLHRDHGVDLRTNTTLVALDNAGSHSTARLSDGTQIEVDTVVVGIGAEPNTTLADSAGLPCSNGIDVDVRLRTSDPFVYAAGDVANHDHPILGRIRVEHWDTAVQQGRHVAQNMLGASLPYNQQPYFFTDQYELGMEYIGHVSPDGYDTVHISGNLADRIFTAYWTRGGTVIAGMHVNDWDATDRIRELIGGPAAALPG